MIEGDIIDYVRVLGAREGDDRLTQALARIGGEFTTTTYHDRGFEEKYFVNADRGVDFLLKGGELSSIFFYAGGHPDHRPYPRWSSLIDRVGAETAREGIVHALGAPQRATELSMVYAVGEGFVRFRFDDGALTMAVAQRSVPGASAGAVPEAATSSEPPGGTERAGAAVPAPTSEPMAVAPGVEGDLMAFLDALGTQIHSPEHLALIVLAGPAMEVEADEHDGAAWQYHHFPKTGVILQFKDRLLVGALVRLIGDEEEAAYPWPDRLVSGFALPAPRAQINEYFGAARYANEDMDLYLVAERYVQFNYDDGQSADITVILPGADA